jgi:hypothetical protein
MLSHIDGGVVSSENEGRIVRSWDGVVQSRISSGERGVESRGGNMGMAMAMAMAMVRVGVHI